MGKSLVGFIPFLFSFVLVSCGPEKTAREREMDQLNRTVQKNKAENDKVAGWYLGQINYIRGAPGTTVKNQVACTYIYSTSTFVDIPTRGEKIEIAILGAYLFIKGTTITYVFGNSILDTDANIIRFTGDKGLLELGVSGNSISGNFYAPHLVNEVVGQKTTREVCTKEIF